MIKEKELKLEFALPTLPVFSSKAKDKSQTKQSVYTCQIYSQILKYAYSDIIQEFYSSAILNIF